MKKLGAVYFPIFEIINNMNHKEDFINRVFVAPPVYFLNSLEETAIKSVDGKTFLVKFKGGKPFVSDAGDKLSKMVANGIIEKNEITEEEWNSF